MEDMFAGFDREHFWEPSEYALKEYVGAPLTAEAVAAAESELGYTLPADYVEFMRFQNGGIPRRTNHRTKGRTTWADDMGGRHGRTTWADDHIAINGIYSIGSEKRHSLGGTFGSRFWVEEWGYPDIRIYADCPSAGHDMLCLDYRVCGPTGEPQVVHVDQEWDYKIVFVAENFAAFVLGLEDESAFEDDAEGPG